MTSSISIPAEWAPQSCIWTAWPSHPDLWQDNLAPARKEIADMILALASAGKVNVLAMGRAAELSAEKALPHKNVTIVQAQFGDIWLRDTGPIFAKRGDQKIALTFGFNGWGGKYDLPHDGEVSTFVAQKSSAEIIANDFILEGGAIEIDGEGTVLTTSECLLNPNRNPSMNKTQIEDALKQALGAKRIIWLDKGLKNDHTDGHIDNIARFIAPGHALCQSPNGADDPNAQVLDDIALQLEKAGLKVSTIPSPGLIKDEDGKAQAASHMNYIIFNDVIVMPMYNVTHGAKAAEALGKLFPKHKIIALPAKHVLSGGGSFHCITQQEF